MNNYKFYIVMTLVFAFSRAVRLRSARWRRQQVVGNSE
ncbi:hypothetical protein ANCCAN_16457 [Ancylostoma caninum]|uniref:Uncharacterized protein n=1 Tax=Ancylostoma caninum TaxID=29170 RepID=A0A368G3N0_ANCCA|nr:hypothetical protein ANCCAN_16457 [Ancylostoma caninum]